MEVSRSRFCKAKWYSTIITCMSKKTILIAIVALVIVIAGGAWYFNNNPLGPSLSYTVIETGDRQHKENTDYYTVQVNYPDKTPLATRGSWGAEKRAEATIASTLDELISQFKQAGNVDNLSQEEKDRLNKSGIKYSLNIGYHTYSSGNFVSYEFDIFMDTGGAHPNNLYRTLVFDMKGNTVSLDSLFTSSDYLDRISTAATTQVQNQLRQKIGGDPSASFVAEGTTAKIENFSNFVIDSDRIRIFIPPYQAAAYAAGSFEVQIPFADVKDILKPEVK
jgi:hypothetical protein